MKLRKIYIIIIDDIVYATSTNYKQILDMFWQIKKNEPKAYIQEYYA